MSYPTLNSQSINWKKKDTQSNQSIHCKKAPNTEPPQNRQLLGALYPEFTRVLLHLPSLSVRMTRLAYFRLYPKSL